MAGHRLVWTDNRNEMEEHYTHADIYSYDILTGRESPVAVAPGVQTHPSVHGDIVVWQDNRNSPVMGTGMAGCSNCPENRFDIYIYDFRTGREEALAEGDSLKQEPWVYEDHVVWAEFGDGGMSDIHLLDLSTRETRKLTTAAGDGPRVSPMIAGNHVIWLTRWACDALPQPHDTGVFVYDLGDGTVRQLSNYVEPGAWIDDGIVLIGEGCWSPQRVYSVRLE